MDERDPEDDTRLVHEIVAAIQQAIFVLEYPPEEREEAFARLHDMNCQASLPAGAAEGTANVDLTWKPQLYPDYRAPLVIRGEDGADHAHFARWGLPSPLFALQGKKTDPGVTNVRNTASPHWRRWLGPANRCLVPLDAFSEPDQVGGTKKPVWFTLADDRPLAYFAGIHVPNWTSTRKVREGEITCDLYGFLTADAHPLVAQFHTKATPVILTAREECEAWLTAPWEEAKALQRTPPAEALKIRPATTRHHDPASQRAGMV